MSSAIVTQPELKSDVKWNDEVDQLNHSESNDALKSATLLIQTIYFTLLNEKQNYTQFLYQKLTN